MQLACAALCDSPEMIRVMVRHGMTAAADDGSAADMLFLWRGIIFLSGVRCMGGGVAWELALDAGRVFFAVRFGLKMRCCRTNWL